MTQPRRRPTSNSPDPVLITDAARSYEEELGCASAGTPLMMGMRVPCMVLAAVFYETPWLAVTLLVISIPLPWMAVLIANDRLPRKSEKVNRYEADRTALEARPHPVIDPGTRASTVRWSTVRWSTGDVLDDRDVTPDARAAPADGLRSRGAARPQRRFRACPGEPRREQTGVEGVTGARGIHDIDGEGAHSAHTVAVHPARPRRPRRNDHGARDLQQRHGRGGLGRPGERRQLRGVGQQQVDAAEPGQQVGRERARGLWVQRRARPGRARRRQCREARGARPGAQHVARQV